MDESETLFSLELAVESLRIHSTTVVCRLPAVAFRLLDFPTLLLHHVDPENVTSIKEKIQMERFGDVPNQLQELKDHRGNFRLNKCKSSLFKMSPRMLLGYLRNTPLYIMLIDVWPETSKLVANCTVSLQQTMEEIEQDIQQNGTDVPSVHGNRDSYKLFNLMGSEVGWIVVRHRLLSMGASLIPHVPQTAFAKRGSESVDLTVTPRKSKDVSVTISDSKTVNKDVVLEDLEIEGQPQKISVAISTMDDPDFNPKAKLSEQLQKGTQTLKSRKQNMHHKKEFDGSIPLLPNNDLIVNNTHCPPPLFFNTANEDASLLRPYPKSSSKNHREIVNPPCVENEKPLHQIDPSEDLSTASSHTLSEDIVHQIEAHYTFPAEDQHISSSPSWSVRKTHRTVRSEKSRIEKSQKNELSKNELREMRLSHDTHSQGVDVCSRCQLQFDPSHQTQLPVLAALLQELSLLHGNALQVQHEPTLGTPSQFKKTQARPKPQSSRKEPLLAPDEKENIHIHHPQGSNQATKPYRHKHRECAKPPQGVPATKGWLRQQQPVEVSSGKRKTKLQYGMTHSQKLRLRKNNPELLKELEMQELRMKTLKEEKERLVIMKNHRREEDDFIDADQQNISTEIAHHSDGEEQPALSHSTMAELPPTTDKRNDISRSGRLKHNTRAQRRPPVPVPRGGKGATFVWGDTPLHLEAAVENNTQSSSGKMQHGLDAGISGHEYDRSRRERDELVEQKDVSSSEKSARSIDVYLPSASANEPESGSDSDDAKDTDSQFSSASSFAEHPKTIQVPGLPSEEDYTSQKDLDHTDDQSNVQYSDDFVGSDNLASTGEQELEPLASSQSDSYRSAESRLSDDSRSGSSVRTTKSQTSQVAATALRAPIPRPNGKVDNPQTRLLGIPKPKLSSISPVPVRRTSKTSTVSLNTAVVTPDTPQDTVRSPTPPTPKPRSSLHRSVSSYSDTSFLQSTVPSSEFRTEDSQHWTNKTESEDGYSDDFNHSDTVISDHSNTF